MERAHAAQIVYGGLVASTMFTVMTVPYDAVLNSRENMRYYAFVGILESVLKLFVAFACVYASHDRLIVYGVLMACIPFITFLSCYYIAINIMLNVPCPYNIISIGIR